MIRITRRTSAALLLGGVLIGASGPVAAHSPSPLIGWPAWDQDQVVYYRWMAGEVPPAAMRTAITAGAADANRTRGSRAPTFFLAESAASTVEYGVNVFCGVNGLACADGSRAPERFRLGYREHQHRFDWGQLRWCQMLTTIANGCFDAENITLDEFGHVLGLGHHVNHPDESDYGDSVVQTFSRARPQAHWNADDFGRCDVARLQTRYDMQTWTDPYSTCLDLNVVLTLQSSAGAIRAGTTVTFTATLTVADNADDGRLNGNPITNRQVSLQRRPPGAANWTAMGVIPNGSVPGTYVVRQSPTATYEWRAVFAPGNEGLNARNSGSVVVTVTTCSGGCPQSAPAPQEEILP